MMNNKEILLSMKHIKKSFFGVTVLNDVDFELKHGEVISIIGSNGAGKSTLSNIIAGVLVPEEGDIYIEGKKVKISDPNDAETLGIGMVHQEPTLCENMKVYENIFLNREILKKGFMLDQEKMKDESKKMLKYLGFEIDVCKNVQDISLVGKAVVSIAKAMMMNPKILILDEVTAPLNNNEVEHLFEIIDGLRKKGLGIIYISHKIREIVQISDKVNVLRDGKIVGIFDAEVETLREKDIINLMLGENEWAGEYSERNLGKGSTQVLLEADGLTKKGMYENISFQLHKNEIIGLAGLKGSGITELLYSIFGIMKYEQGTLKIDGRVVKAKNPGQAIKNGIGMITNDRQREELALMLPIKDNIIISSLNKVKNALGLVSEKKAKNAAREYVDTLSIKSTGIKQPVQYLSGGNQQKVVVAKWLMKDSDVILIDEPTRGVDVKAKNEIYDLLLAEKDKGKGMLVFSPEVRELLNFCNRILVVSRGNIIKEIRREDHNFSEKGVLEAMHSY